MYEPKSDARKPNKKQDYLGQVFTSMPIAQRMVNQLLDQKSLKAASILDPCVGPFTFPKALIQSRLLSSYRLTVVDIDPDMTGSEFNCDGNFSSSRAITADYLLLDFDENFDFAILNPPYIRQEWIEKKKIYQKLFKEKYGLTIPGTSNLYVYFIVKVIHDLSLGGYFSAILYDSWQSTRYGKWLVHFLNTFCDSITIEPVSNQPFNGRLIDATIIYGRKSHHLREVNLHFKDAVPWISEKFSPFRNLKGFNRIDNLFHTKRGLRLKQSNFFLCNLKLVEQIGARPFVKKIGLIDGFEVPIDHPEAVLLVQSGENNPDLLNELELRILRAQKHPSKNKSILNWYRERPEVWYLHTLSPKAPILFNYYLRNRPRHIFNPSRVYADNFYGLTPHDTISIYAWLAVLNSTCVCVELLANARNQGNGLAKLQLFEYRNACIPDLNLFSRSEIKVLEDLGRLLANGNKNVGECIQRIDHLIAEMFADDLLTPLWLGDLYQEFNKRAKKPKTKT